MQEWLLATVGEMRCWALGLGFAGIISATTGYVGLFEGVIAPFEALPLIVFGQVGIVSAIVSIVLRRIFTRAAAKKIDSVPR
jgi:hypothetical protein